MIPSKYQSDIFNFIKSGHGNAMIAAVAGSGKSTTIIECLKLVPSHYQALFLAFNKSIIEELQERLPKNAPNVQVKTLHGFGMSAMVHAYRSTLQDDKYKKIADSMMPHWDTDGVEDKLEFRNKVVKLSELGRLNLMVEPKDILKLAELHDIVCLNKEEECTSELIKVGTKNVKNVDFTDMIYLPVALKLHVKQFEYIFIDESQDLNACQRELMLKAIRPKNGRFIAVGDERQAIYFFAGADSDSFKKLAALPNTKHLPLSVCYRCDQSIIDLAQTIVPEIEARPNASAGIVNHAAVLADLKDGDMVLCRNTFPLVKLCMKLLAKEVKAHIVGRDIGINLINMLKGTKQFDISDAMHRLSRELEKIKMNLMGRKGLSEAEAREEMAYVSYEEKINVIEILSRNIDSVKEVCDKIEKIFQDKSKDGIKLSTIHKAKGLENNRVFIIHKDLMPSKMAKTPAMKEQENNLIYVAYTRAKNYLGFITDFDAYDKKKTTEKKADVAEQASVN